MRLLALSVATATVLAFAFPQAPQALAQSTDGGGRGRSLELDGGPAIESDHPGQSGSRSQGNAPSAGAKSKDKRGKPPRDVPSTRPPFGGYVEHFGGQRRTGMLFQRRSADALLLPWGPARAKLQGGLVGPFLASGATRRPPRECLRIKGVSGLDSHARAGCGGRCCRGPAPIPFF